MRQQFSDEPQAAAYRGARWRAHFIVCNVQRHDGSAGSTGPRFESVKSHQFRNALQVNDLQGIFRFRGAT